MRWPLRNLVQTFRLSVLERVSRKHRPNRSVMFSSQEARTGSTAWRWRYVFAAPSTYLACSQAAPKREAPAFSAARAPAMTKVGRMILMRAINGAAREEWGTTQRKEQNLADAREQRGIQGVGSYDRSTLSATNESGERRIHQTLSFRRRLVYPPDAPGQLFQLLIKDQFVPRHAYAGKRSWCGQQDLVTRSWRDDELGQKGRV